MNEIRNSTRSLTEAHLDSTTAAGKDDPSPPSSPHPLRRGGGAASWMGRGRTANLANRSFVIPRPARAFTLIEVLLAVSVFAIVLIAINTVFYSALRLRATTARVLDQSAPLQQTLIVLRRDLHGAVPRSEERRVG